MPSKGDLLEQQIYKLLKGQDPDKLRSLLRDDAELKELKVRLGPRTKEELWQWFKDRIGIELSRVPVCPGHSCQLDMAWEVYSFEVTRVLWVVNRGGAKCVAAGTMVYDAETGHRRPVEDLPGLDLRVASMDEKATIVPASALCWAEGEKHCLRVTSNGGRSIVLSDDHPLFTHDGWVKADRLRKGDQVACNRAGEVSWCSLIKIERVGVCEVFDISVPGYGNFVADDFIVHNTSTMSWLDECQGEYFPGFSAFTIGATQTQGQLKYEHMLPLVVEGGVIGGKELDHVIRSIATETQLKNGSKLAIADGGTPSAANGPRSCRLQRDETELMRDDTYKQAGNIPAGKKLRDGRYAPAQIVDTSTMKQAGGRIDTQIQEYQKAVEAGIRPAMEVRISCIYESSVENPTCCCVSVEERESRLAELGIDTSIICDCPTRVSDVWPSEDPDQEPIPRTLESVCQGRFFRSRGFKEFSDIQTLFWENDLDTWNAEQECSSPSREGNFIRSYSQVLHGIRDYLPDPDNGTIYSGTDWGSADESSHGWYQLLVRDVVGTSYKGRVAKVLPAGSLIRFGEVFKKGLGNIDLGKLVQAQEAEWMLQFPGWRVHERYVDSANLAGRLDWRDQLSMPTVSRIKKSFVEELKLVRTLVGKREGRSPLFYVDVPACPSFDQAIRSWRQQNGREIHDASSHPMAEARYVVANLHVIERKNSVGQSRTVQPEADDEDINRAREREGELVGAVKIVRDGTAPWEDEEIFDGDVAGAESSPNRGEARRMAGEDDWRADFGENFSRRPL